MSNHDLLSKYMRFEASKYSDLSSILEKLEGQGFIQELYDLLRKIFHNETNFTFQELKKIAESNPPQKFKLESQFRINNSIFKSNFALLIQLLIDNVYESISQISLRSPEDNVNGTRADSTLDLRMETDRVSMIEKGSPTDDNSEIFTQNVFKSRGSSPQSLGQSPVLSKTHSPRSGLAVTQERAQSPSSPSLAQNRSERKFKTNSAVLSTSNIQSPLQTILSKSNSKKSIKNIANTTKKSNNPNSITSISRVSSNRLNQSTLNISSNSNNISRVVSSPIKQSTLNSMRANTSMNASRLSRLGDVSMVSSEFNFISGHAKFNTAKRKTLEVSNENPGVGHYEKDRSEDSILRRSPSPTIGKADKGSWIDTMVARNHSPGPGALYPSMHFVSKPSK